MDLVKAYDTEMDEDSEVEEIPITPPKKTVDVIQLDSDSEDENPPKKVDTENEKQSVKLTPPHIDCIDLDSTPEKNSPVKRICDILNLRNTTDKNSSLKRTSVDLNVNDSAEKDCPMEITSEVLPNLLPTPQKKIDYLNLEGSESEDENESHEKTIRTLIDNASVLIEKPLGPQKASNTVNILDNITENVSKQTDKVAELNSKTDSNLSRSTSELLQNSESRDSFENTLLDSTDKVPAETFSLDINNTSENLSCIFREDKRVIDASKKIILCRIPHQIIQTHNAHSNVISSLSWCIPKFSYLFLSASKDGSLKIWDLYRTNSVQCIKVNSGLNAAKWSLDGGQIVAGGFQKKAFVYDVQTGKKIVQYDIYNLVSCIECHPYMEDVFLVGTKDAILGFDVRVNTTFPIRTFFSKCEEVLDLTFLDENEFICSTNIVSRDSEDRTIMAWDFASGAKLSKQIYLERYTCPSLKVHPSDSTFIAQTNGNYIAAFSTNQPYKMKDKRYAGHKVSGYGIECDISPDGKYIVSGDVEGSLYFYSYSTASVVLVTPKQNAPTNRVKWHPVLSSTLISSTYDGQIHVWK